MTAMARHRTHSIEFKRRVVENTSAATQRRNAVITVQPLQHDPDLLFD